MTSKEKSTIHELLSAYRIGASIEQLRRHLLPSQNELREKLAQLEGRNEHFKRASASDYSHIERRKESDDMVKSLQLILSKIVVNDTPRSLADIIGRDLEEDFIEREQDKVVPPPEHTDATQGFFGEVSYEGSPSKKGAILTVDKSYGATYHRAVQALRQGNIVIENGDRDGGTLRGSTVGNSHARFGELVLMWFTPQPKGNTKVEIIVDSNLKDTTFDMGRHQKLLDQLVHKVKYG